MSIKSRFGASGFLLFSAICGIAGTSVASAAAGSDAKKNVQDAKVLQGVEEDAEEQTDLPDGEEDLLEDYSELESLLKETDKVSWSLTKTLAVAIPTSLAVSGGTALLLNPELRKKAVETVFGSGSFFGSKDTIKEKTVDLEKMFDEWYAKRKAAEEKAEKEKTEKAEKGIPSEKEKAWERLMARGNRGISFALTPRTKAANWVFGVLDRVLPKNVSSKLKGWFYLDDARENGIVFKVLYALALIYSLVNMVRLVYVNPDVLSKEYFLALFYAKQGPSNGGKLQRFKISVLKTLDYSLRLIIPPYAFVRAGLELAGNMYYLVDPVTRLKGLFSKFSWGYLTKEALTDELKKEGELKEVLSGIMKTEIGQSNKEAIGKPQEAGGLLEGLKIKVNKIEKKIDALKVDEKIGDLNTKVEGIQQKNKSLEDAYKDMSGKVFTKLGSLETNIEKLQKDVAKLPKNIAEKGELESLKNQVNEIKQKIDDLKVDKKIDEKINSLKTELKGDLKEHVNKELESAFESLDSRIKELGNKVDSFDKDTTTIGARFKEVKEKIKLLEKTVTDVQADQECLIDADEFNGKIGQLASNMVNHFPEDSNKNQKKVTQEDLLENVLFDIDGEPEN